MWSRRRVKIPVTRACDDNWLQPGPDANVLVKRTYRRAAAIAALLWFGAATGAVRARYDAGRTDFRRRTIEISAARATIPQAKTVHHRHDAESAEYDSSIV